jgi:two-component system cell cycle sensor histidine kinase/response regulator CckA
MSAGRQTSEAGRLRQMTVLLVEDDLQVAKVTSNWLRKMGYHVLVSHDGKSACDLAAKRTATIDLLLTDVMLPGMRGPVLAGVIRARHPEMAVLFSSGYSPELVGELFTAHTNTAMLLRKPYNSKQLAAQVQLALDRKARGMRVTDVPVRHTFEGEAVPAGAGGAERD